MKLFFRTFFFTYIIHSVLCCALISAAVKDTAYQRIISLYPAHTENLVSLGVDRQLIGISASDTWPDRILDLPRFSIRDNAEKFIAAAPDLVLIRPMLSHNTPELFTRLEEAGISVVSIQPRNIDEMFTYWRKLGELSGLEEAAEAMISNFQRELKSLREAISHIPENRRPRVYFESIHTKMKTFSPSSIAVFVLREAGGINIADDATPRRNSNIAAYGKERILSHAADIDIYLAQHGRMNRVSREQIALESGFGAIKAVQNDKIFIIEEELVSRPTLRIIDGIREMRNILFQRPESF